MSLERSGAVRIGTASPTTMSPSERAGSRARRTRTRVRLVPDSLADFLQLPCDRRKGQLWIHRWFPLYRASWELTAFKGDLPIN
jgi:hypothetical protein